MGTPYDLLIRGAKVFDGTGNGVRVEDVGVRDGRIAARGDLSDASAVKVIEADGQWLMPGLLDVHTHYDLELEVAPGLPESTRHGTTTVVIANCSLGLAFGAQRRDGADPIVDCYARVENIPKGVLRAIADGVDWNTPAEYVEHLQQLNNGPNVVTLFPHSMLRIEVMGFEASISRDPTEHELARMKQLLGEALDMGYAGFSTDALPFHYLANQPNCQKTIPTQFAKYAEIKALTDVVRERGAIWQATPPKDSMIGTIRTFLLTSGRLHGKPLKTTVVAAMDVHSNRKIVRLGRLLSRLLNSWLLRGDFHLQALAAPFKTWSDGAVTPLAEEIPELRKLNEIDLEDRQGRRRILDDPEFVAEFRRMWMKGKKGFSVARIKRLLRLEDYAFTRALEDMNIEVCPVPQWQGKTFADVLELVQGFQSKDSALRLTPEEKAILDGYFADVRDEADLVLAMLRAFDIELSWSTVSANRNPETIRKLVMDPLLLPGFNDSGAHLTNMAFYDANLRALRLAAQGGDADVAYMVRRLTRDPAAVFGIDAGTMDAGDPADLVLIDPVQLQQYDGESRVDRVYRSEFDHEQLVNRSDGVVSAVVIGGSLAFRNGDFTENFNRRKLGRILLRGDKRRPSQPQAATSPEVAYG